jgi:hypothetical protein
MPKFALGVGVATVRARRGDAAAAPLDELATPPVAAYSLRRLRAGYTGPAVKVRRSTDNAESDIGFTVGGDLDVPAVLAFAGSGSAFVSQWHDQGTAAHHAVQAIAAAQPRIVNASLIVTRGGLPAIQSLAGSNSGFASPMLGIAESQPRTVCAVFGVDQSVNNAELFGTDTGHIVDFGTFNGANRVRFRSSPSGEVYSGPGTWPISATPAIASFDGLANRTKAWRNGGGVLNSATVAFAWRMDTLLILQSSLPGRGLIGSLQEFVIFAAALPEPERVVMARNQSAYYGVAVP